MKCQILFFRKIIKKYFLVFLPSMLSAKGQYGISVESRHFNSPLHDQLETLQIYANYFQYR